MSHTPRPMPDVFQDLSEVELQAVDRTMTISICQQGRIFYRPEDKGDVLFIVKEGRVRLYRLSAEGHKQVVATIARQSMFGEMALLGQGMHQTFAEAAEDCVLYVLTRQDVERLIISHPTVALRIMRAMAARMDRLRIEAQDTIPQNGRIRLAAHLLRLREEQGADEIYGYTPQDLGEAVGISREMTMQILKDLQSAQLTKIGREHLTVVDPAGLEAKVADAKD